MGVTRSVGRQVGRQLAPKLTQLAPGLTSGFVREALHRAIEGVGPLPPAADAADKQLREQHGDVDKAIREVIENHVSYAAVEGLVTNVGGLVTMAVTVPANITGLALIQCRMVAGIAHLRGYDLSDPRVRNAILVTVLGEDAVNRLLKRKSIPGPPMAVATAPVHHPELDQAVAKEVATEIITRVAGRRLVTTIGRRVPLAGGVVALGVDGYATWKIGRYARREFLPRPR